VIILQKKLKHKAQQRKNPGDSQQQLGEGSFTQGCFQRAAYEEFLEL
jgi:hypothetical protein